MQKRTLAFGAAILLSAVACSNETALKTPQADQTSEWKLINSKKGRFTVNLPSRKLREETFGSGNSTRYAHVANIPHAVFMVYYIDCGEDLLTAANAELRMDQDLAIALKNSKGQLVTEKRIKTMVGSKEYPGREYEMLLESQDLRSRSRVFAVESRLYTVQIDFRKSESFDEEIKKCFDSFVIAPE